MASSGAVGVFKWFLPLVCVPLLFGVGNGDGIIFRYEWSQSMVPGNFGSNPATETESSAVSCAQECYAREICAEFCYNVTSRECYVNGLVTSLEDVGEELLCYGSCPLYMGYRVYNGRCIKLFLTSMTYYDARDRCALDGAHLYDFRSVDWDQQPVIDIFADEQTTPTGFWTGVTDLAVEGQFVWSDGTLIPAGSDVWRASEPNGGENENCATLSGIALLNDSQCQWERHFICQIDVK
ncbi:hypothetical protein BaRGS_00003087 [Batillaria attramentaria]|uniref:C-type lectin domain-containing protein n=1 Tax=Batillaria attramentaria TaxID=370345 RepID=A0ABD0M3C7_9CAEN